MSAVLIIPEAIVLEQRILAGLCVSGINTSNQPAAIKLKQPYLNDELLTGHLLAFFSVPVVLQGIFCLAPEILRQARIWVLTVFEAEMLLKRSLSSQILIEEAAYELKTRGAGSVMIQEVSLQESWKHDYWTDGSHSFWLSKSNCFIYRDLREVSTTAITSFLALGYKMQDAVVLGEMYVHQATRLRETQLYPGGFPEEEHDLPLLAPKPLYSLPLPFKRSPYLGLYPIVESLNWVNTLLQLGVKTIQLRIKKRSNVLELEIKRSIALAKKYQALLFINDYWELALKYGAEAVHLGQNDLENADLQAIHQQGLFLGVSTHCYYEVARAHALNPSYMAIGPIYPTTSKIMNFAPQGISQLERWRRTLKYPLVAIGGITLDHAQEVNATGVSGIALISAITQSRNPELVTRQLLAFINSKRQLWSMQD